MCRLIVALLTALAVYVGWQSSSRQASAADLAPFAAPVKAKRCLHGNCVWPRYGWRGCPDRYSCSALYGAYGPYGGEGYWAAYSPAWSWGAYR